MRIASQREQFPHRTAMAEDYWMSHRPAGPDGGAPLHDLTGSGMLPEDVYTHPQYYDFSGDGAALSNWDTFNSVRGNPDAMVDIYRSTPKGNYRFNDGDWVALREDYARQEGLHSTDPSKDNPVMRSRVPASSLYTSGDSFDEFGYWGPQQWGTVVQSDIDRGIS